MVKYLCCSSSAKPEPIMLLILPIVLSRISHNFHLFLIYSHAITYHSILILMVSLIKLDMAADKLSFKVNMVTLSKKFGYQTY